VSGVSSPCDSFIRAAEPRVVGTIRNLATLRVDAAALRRQCDAVEVRLDKIGPDAPDWPDLCSVLEAGGIPVIVTLRAAAEGGSWTGPEPRREEILLAALERVSAVDIELAAAIRTTVCRQAARLARTLIVSYHNFEFTPPLPDLADIVRRARMDPVCVPKLAAMIRSPADTDALLRLLGQERAAGPLCVIGMGGPGSETRIAFPVAGSCLAYGFIDEPVAPGQIPAARLKAEIAARKMRAG